MIDKSIAIIDDKQSIYFPDLSKIISKTAQYYLDNGVKPKNNIALIGDNSIEYVITVYSLWKLGAIPLPINTRLKDDEIKSIINSSNCSIIIKDENFSTTLSGFNSIKMFLKSDEEECNINNEAKPDDVAVIIHTSGSSGTPKGVETTNNNLYQSYLLATTQFNFSDRDIFLASLPFYHIGGFSIINRALLSGGTLVLPKSLKQNDIMLSLEKYNPTIVSFVPTMLKRFIENGINPNNNLRLLFLGGGPSSDKLISSALKNKWPIVKVYGSSETTAMITACSGNELKMIPASAGKPFDGIKIKILDETKSLVANNVVGEIAIKSATIARGYLNEVKSWHNKFHNDYYLSGDYGYIDENGLLFVVARRTDLIISGGENISPHEVELYLNEHFEIADSFVFPINDIEWGQIPVAVLVLENNSSLTEYEIVNYLKSKISSYKIPKQILVLDEIPKTALGKVNIEAVRALFAKSN
jgi:o-succinylbenzoate---CoA ligase